MSKKAPYRAVPIERLASASLAAVLAGATKLVVAIDVAKTKMMAGFGREDGSVVQLVRFTSQAQTRGLVDLVSETATLLGVGVEALMEPSGTYGDGLRALLCARGASVFMLSPKRVHDARDVRWRAEPARRQVVRGDGATASSGSEPSVRKGERRARGAPGPGESTRGVREAVAYASIAAGGMTAPGLAAGGLAVSQGGRVLSQMSDDVASGLSRAGAAEGVAPSSRALGQALEAAGHVRPASSAAHHIVAGKARIAAQARTVLQRFGIGINDAAKGVFLPAARAAPNPAGAAVHSPLHTRAYYDTVNEMLGAATTRAEAEAALGAIRDALLSGGL